jgi:hypothetical protein
MNEPSASDQTNLRFVEAVRAYAPTVSRKWQKLLGLKPGIAELRRNGASYQAITEILRASDVPVSRKTVARFCQAVLRPSQPRKQRRPASRNSLSQPQSSFVALVSTGRRRIANPRIVQPCNGSKRSSRPRRGLHPIVQLCGSSEAAASPRHPEPFADNTRSVTGNLSKDGRACNEVSVWNTVGRHAADREGPLVRTLARMSRPKACLPPRENE